MNLNFNIPTPKSCDDCKFHYVDKNDKDHSWAIRCLICQDVEQNIQDARDKRSDKCIGTVDDGE